MPFFFFLKNWLGYVLGNGSYGGGGLLRDWKISFSKSLGFTNSFIAELWALRDVLTLAWEYNLNSLIVEMDTMSVVQMILLTC